MYSSSEYTNSSVHKPLKVEGGWIGGQLLLIPESVELAFFSRLLHHITSTVSSSRARLGQAILQL